MPVDQTAAVHAAITLTAAQQTITTEITAPNTARALSVTGTKAGSTLTGTVTINGSDQHGQTVSADFALADNATVHANLPQDFASLTSIVVPARVNSGDTVKVGYQDRLFDLVELRAFGKAQITAAAYADAICLRKENEIRDWLEEACGCAFLPRLRRDYIDGSGTDTLYVPGRWLLAVTACVIYDSEMTASETFDASDLADLAIDETTSRIVRRTEGVFLSGEKNILVTYLHGHRVVPDLIRRAALQIAETEMPATNVPYGAESYDEAGVPVSYARGDGFAEQWHRIPDVVKAIRLYNASPLGIA